MNFVERRHISARAIQELRPTLVLGPRGFPLNDRRQWGIGDMGTLRDKVVLVQGTGNGWDLADWAKYQPKRLIGVDLFEFDSWNDVKNYVESNGTTKVEFQATSLERVPYLSDCSVDLCASDAVFEHVRDMPALLAETYRVLRPGGVVYATYGPIWYTAGGDHYSGRGGLENVFNHVRLGPQSYRDYFDSQKVANEDFQSGGRYVELDLFSKLKTSDYLAAFRNAGFDIDDLIIEVSRDAIRFKQEFPDHWRQTLNRNPGITADDLLIKANFVRLKKPNR
jgi:SAM-dependent methyltransferase